MDTDDYPDWLGEPVPKEEADRIMTEYLSYTAGIDPDTD